MLQKILLKDSTRTCIKNSDIFRIIEVYNKIIFFTNDFGYRPTSEPCSRFRTNLHAAGSAPAIVSSISPGNALAALMMFLFCHQLVHELLTPSFARNICYTRHSGTVLSELVVVTNLILRDVLV